MIKKNKFYQVDRRDWGEGFRHKSPQREGRQARVSIEFFLCSFSQTLVTTTQPLITAGETDGARKVKASQREVGEGVPEGEMQFLPLKSW